MNFLFINHSDRDPLLRIINTILSQGFAAALDQVETHIPVLRSVAPYTHREEVSIIVHVSHARKWSRVVQHARGGSRRLQQHLFNKLRVNVIRDLEVLIDTALIQVREVSDIAAHQIAVRHKHHFIIKRDHACVKDAYVINDAFSA